MENNTYKTINQNIKSPICEKVNRANERFLSANRAMVDKIDVKVRPINIFPYLDDPVHAEFSAKQDTPLGGDGFGTIIPKPTNKYFVSLNDIMDDNKIELYKKIVDLNVDGKIDYSIAPLGLHYNRSLLKTGNLPVNLSLLGGEDKLVATIHENKTTQRLIPLTRVSDHSASTFSDNLLSMPGYHGIISSHEHYAFYNGSISYNVDAGDEFTDINSLKYHTPIITFSDKDPGYYTVRMIVSTAPISVIDIDDPNLSVDISKLNVIDGLGDTYLIKNERFLIGNLTFNWKGETYIHDSKVKIIPNGPFKVFTYSRVKDTRPTFPIQVETEVRYMFKYLGWTGYELEGKRYTPFKNAHAFGGFKHPFAATTRPLITRNNAGDGSVKMITPANTQFGFLPINGINHSEQNATNPNLSQSCVSTSGLGNLGMFTDGYVYYDGYLIGSLDDIQSGYNSKLYYDNGWFMKIDIPAKWKQTLKYLWKKYATWDRGVDKEMFDSSAHCKIKSMTIPPKFWKEWEGQCPHVPTDNYDLVNTKLAWEWYVDKFIDTFFLYVYCQGNNGQQNDAFGSVANIFDEYWESDNPQYKYYYYDHETGLRQEFTTSQWKEKTYIIDANGNRRAILFFNICDGAAGYKASYTPVPDYYFYQPSGYSASPEMYSPFKKQSQYMTDGWKLGYSSIGMVSNACLNSVNMRHPAMGDPNWITRNEEHQFGFSDKDANLGKFTIETYPTTGKTPCVTAPFGKPLFIDSTVTASFDRLYNANYNLYYRNPGVKTTHFSAEISSDPVVLNSSILSQTIDKQAGVSYTDDYIFSLFLSRDEKLVDQISKNNTPIPKDQLIDNIIEDAKDKARVLRDNQENDKEYLIINDLRNTLQSHDSSISPIAHLYDKFNNPYIFNDEEFFNYRFVLCGHAAEENPIGVIGHNRVLRANPKESPIIDKLYEVGLDDGKIMYYSSVFSQLASSIYNFNVDAMCDVMDIYNEISLLSLSTNSQISTISDAVNTISNKIEASGGEIDDDLKQLIGNFSNVSADISNNLLDMSVQLEQTINSVQGVSYDDILLTRNVNKSTKYSKDLAEALASDPYLAVQQHNAYITQRLNTLSNKLSAANIVIGAVNGILKLPIAVLEGLAGIGKIIGTIISIGIKGAANTVKVIDNIDKLIFIDETFVSKGITEYATIPTYFDKIFKNPDFDPNLIGPSDYDDIRQEASVMIENVDISPANFISQSLINLDNTDPIYDKDGNQVTYNNYDVSKLLSTANGYYLPTSTDQPILSIGNNKAILLPNLLNHSIKHPAKGNILKKFLLQLFCDDQNVMAEVESLSSYIPLSDNMLVTYGWIVAGLSVAAGLAGAMSGLIKGDPIKAIIGGVSAAATVATVNGIEMDNILERRTSLNDTKSVYTYFSRNYEDIKSQWSDKLNNDYIINSSYNLVISDTFRPSYLESSDYKKTFLYIKEAIALIVNSISMLAVSYSIGLISGAIVDSARLIHNRRILAKQRDFENTLALQNKDKINAEFDKNREDILSRDDLTNEQKDELVKQLDIDKINYNLYIDGKIKLNSKERWRLNNVLATQYGLPPIATSSQGTNNVSKLVTIGALTSESIRDITDKINDFNKQLNEDTGGSFDQIIQDQENNNQLLNSIISITTSLSDSLLGLVTDVKHIKKYV